MIDNYFDFFIVASRCLLVPLTCSEVPFSLQVVLVLLTPNYVLYTFYVEMVFSHKLINCSFKHQMIFQDIINN
jgi:hypothetical protein